MTRFSGKPIPSALVDCPWFTNPPQIPKIPPVLTAPENGELPHSRQHPYEAQLDALESILCSTTLTQALGAAPLHSATELGLLLERYRTNVLEPIELPAIARAHREAAQGRDPVRFNRRSAGAFDNGNRPDYYVPFRRGGPYRSGRE